MDWCLWVLTWLYRVAAFPVRLIKSQNGRSIKVCGPVQVQYRANLLLHLSPSTRSFHGTHVRDYYVWSCPKVTTGFVPCKNHVFLDFFHRLMLKKHDASATGCFRPQVKRWGNMLCWAPVTVWWFFQVQFTIVRTLQNWIIFLFMARFVHLNLLM